MCAAHGEPIVPVPRPGAKGPQLVPPRPKRAAPSPEQAAEAADAHPIVTILIVGSIALIGAITFVWTALTWILVRGTGVNWMFQY